MSAQDAAAFILLGVAGFLAWRQSVAAPEPELSPTAVHAIASGAVTAGVLGGALSTLPPGTFNFMQDKPSQLYPYTFGPTYTPPSAGGMLSLITGTVPMTVTTKAGYLSPAQVKSLAQQTISANGFSRVSASMATAIAIVESGSVSSPALGCNPNAFRQESFDASTGLMQTLLGTAQWLARDMGYKAFGIPTSQMLLRPEVSMYFGCAYLDYLSRYRSQARDAAFIVQSYNAGPGNLSSAYLTKYSTALAWVQQNVGA